jgi:hypothetical protein
MPRHLNSGAGTRNRIRTGVNTIAENGCRASQNIDLACIAEIAAVAPAQIAGIDYQGAAAIDGARIVEGGNSLHIQRLASGNVNHPSVGEDLIKGPCTILRRFR